MKERSEVAGFGEGRPGMARTAAEEGRTSHTTSMKVIADMELSRRFE